MYLEATDQHRGWFQSSLMTSVALHNRAPYKSCVTHGFVVDLDGKKISKSGTYTKPMDAGHFVSRHGADLVRLWVSSINYTDDVPFSEEMFTRLGDTYRRIRNTLRILLGNLYDFESGKQEERKEAPTLIDRWILDRLQQVIDECRTAYANYEFHRVYHVLNQFCAVDLSSLYIDITKDRLYCDAPESPRRRATQGAMSQIFDALCKLLAPILVFTAEEAWQHRRSGRGEAEQSELDGSVHLETFPLPDESRRDELAREMVAELLKLRGVIGQAIENARQEKLIGNSLEAAVVLRCHERFANSVPREELEEFFILSDLTVEAAPEATASIRKTPNEKCARCWRHRPAVGKIAAHPDLCDRCAAVIDAR
jgi:isoleucyl-tRNA synthetase